MPSKEGIEKAINNLWNSLDEELFNLTYSQEEMQEDLRIVLNEYNYLNVLNDRKDQKIRQLESDKQKLIEKLEEKEKLNDKYLQKLVYALSPTTHALGDSYNNAFKSIIADKIDLETCKIKRELKDCWEGRF